MAGGQQPRREALGGQTVPRALQSGGEKRQRQPARRVLKCAAGHDDALAGSQVNARKGLADLAGDDVIGFAGAPIFKSLADA